MVVFCLELADGGEDCNESQARSRHQDATQLDRHHGYQQSADGG
jgi:hypothetical protein